MRLLTDLRPDGAVLNDIWGEIREQVAMGRAELRLSLFPPVRGVRIAGRWWDVPIP